MFQLGSALLDACVLAVIKRGDTYGYLLTQNIRSVIDVSESTLYPVLRRLQQEQMLVTYDSPYNGRNRRYYQITQRGLEHLTFLQENWQQFKQAVEYLLFPTTAAAATDEAAVETTAVATDDAAVETTARATSVADTTPVNSNTKGAKGEQS